MSLPPCGAARHGMARCLPGLESREERADSSSEAVVLQDEYSWHPGAWPPSARYRDVDALNSRGHLFNAGTYAPWDRDASFARMTPVLHVAVAEADSPA